SCTRPASRARRSTCVKRSARALRWSLRKSLMVRKSGRSSPTRARKARLRSQARAIVRQLNRLQEHGPEATHVTVARPQILEIVIVGYPHQVGDLSNGLCEMVPRNASENGVPDAPVRTAGVEQHQARLVE